MVWTNKTGTNEFISVKFPHRLETFQITIWFNWFLKKQLSEKCTCFFFSKLIPHRSIDSEAEDIFSFLIVYNGMRATHFFNPPGWTSNCFFWQVLEANTFANAPGYSYTPEV